MNTDRKADATAGTTRDRQKLQTADRVISAARTLFAEQGFEGTTTRAIAMHAGVAVGTVFAHFPDKMELLAQVLHDSIQQVLDDTCRTIPDAALEDQLVHLSAGLIRYYVGHAALSRELIRHATFYQGEEALAFNRQMRGYVDTCRELVARAIARGELPRDADAAGIARCYLAFHFFVVNGCLRDQQPRVEDSLRQLRQMVTTLVAGYRRPA